MKAIRITTLGSKVTLVFLEEKLDAAPKKFLPSDHSEYAFVIPDSGYTLCVETLDRGAASQALFRSVQVYLAGICGFPFGEYDLCINGKKLSYYISEKTSRYFGGNVGKCKLISSNVGLNSNNYSLTFSEISCKNAIYRISECRDVRGFDLQSLGELVCLKATDREPPFGFICVERGIDVNKLSFYRFCDGIAMPGAEEICAAGYYLHASSAKPVVFELCDGRAYVSIDAQGSASLYTKDFSFSVIDRI